MRILRTCGYAGSARSCRKDEPRRLAPQAVVRPPNMRAPNCDSCGVPLECDLLRHIPGDDARKRSSLLRHVPSTLLAKTRRSCAASRKALHKRRNPASRSIHRGLCAQQKRAARCSPTICTTKNRPKGRNPGKSLCSCCKPACTTEPSTKVRTTSRVTVEFVVIRTSPALDSSRTTPTSRPLAVAAPASPPASPPGEPPQAPSPLGRASRATPAARCGHGATSPARCMSLFPSPPCHETKPGRHAGNIVKAMGSSARGAQARGGHNPRCDGEATTTTQEPRPTNGLK